MEKITSRRNTKCVHAKNLGKGRKYRYYQGEFLCDGKKLLSEALKNNAEIVYVFTTMELDVSLPDSAVVYEVDKDILDSISPLRSSQNVIFTCKTPPPKETNLQKGIHILLDGIQDPSNVGAIIRSADAFGIDSVVLTGSSADPYNPKAVRASMGTIFRQCVHYVDYDELYDKDLRIIGTGNRSDYAPVGTIDMENSIIVLGSEGQGISPELLSLCEQMITIPLSSDCESLNVAAAASIVMWEAVKGRSR